MPAVLHLIGEDAIVGADVVVDDVIALGGLEHGVTHVVVAGPRAFDDDDGNAAGDRRDALGERWLALAGPGSGPALRDVVLLDSLARTLRELGARHGEVALHAHGPHARSLAAVLGRGAHVALLVDAGDERPGHRVLPTPQRTVFSSHGDLDRGLEAGLAARAAALAPPGIDLARPVDRDDAFVVVDRSVHAPQLATVLERRGLRLEPRLTAATARGARVVVVGSAGHLGAGVASAVAAGVPTIALSVPWADELVGCAAFLPREALDLEELLTLAGRRRSRPRRLPRALGRAARTEALAELYAAVVGPRLSHLQTGRRRRR